MPTLGILTTKSFKSIKTLYFFQDVFRRHRGISELELAMDSGSDGRIQRIVRR